MNSLKFRHYPESRFGGFADVDGTVAFYLRVNALLTKDATVLDVGCGRAQYVDDPVPVRRDLRIIRGKCARVIGLDVDEAAAVNPFVDEFHLITGPRWEVEDASVDVCVCDFVVEHLENPDEVFAEFRRVIRPGGYLCIRTPNSRSYVGLMSRLIPNRHHAKVVGRVQETRKEEDVFPTLYRANTRGKLRSLLRRYDFDGCVYGFESEPAYLSFSPLAYRLGVMHQRMAPNGLKPTLFAFGRRSGG